MKKLSSLFLAGTIAMSFVATNANGQLLAAASPAEAIPAVSSSMSAEAGKVGKAGTLNRANTKAFANFSKNFKGVADAKWRMESEVITAQFAKDDVKTTAVYDLKGNLLRTENLYLSGNIPGNISRMIGSSEYRRFKINQVQEFAENGSEFSVIHLEDDKCYKLVVLYEGELQPYKHINKP